MGVEASFLSSLLGTEASAESIDVLGSGNIVKNSQTIALLRADPLSIPTFQNKNKEEEDIKESERINIVSENALLPTTNHISIPSEIEDADSYYDQISIYVVRQGDTISQIAQMFDVSTNTILWGNDMKKNDKLIPGDTLFILPISGVEHTITKGQTLKSIASLYKADISDIVRFNGITEETKLVVGEKIIVPGGEIYNESTSPKSSSSSYTKTPVRNVPGYFINPVPGYSRRSQNLHGPGNRGVDLAAPTGTPIYATAAGNVYFARNGWNGAYGNLVIITHPNGTKTLYAHMSKIATYTGKTVRQGELIGYVGSTGRSTGPHIHFEVFNAKNPGSTTPMSFAPFNY